MRCAQPRVSAALLNRCSALRLVTTSSGFFNNKGLVRSMATQAVSEEAHTWLTSLRWAENLQDHTSGNAQGPTPVHICSAASASGPEVFGKLTPAHNSLAKALSTLSKFKGKPGELVLVPEQGKDGTLGCAILGVGGAAPTPADAQQQQQPSLPKPEEMWAYAALPTRLPEGLYELQGLDSTWTDSTTPQKLDSSQAAQRATYAALGWALGCYAFDRYKSQQTKPGEALPPPRVQGKLVWPQQADKQYVTALAQAFFWARDMINTPAEDLGPQHLVAEATAMAAAHKGAEVKVIQGDDLLSAGYPAVHTVGRASARPPALVDITWQPPSSSGSESLPLVALVGKGVCFDTGGLDIKSAAGMKLMKKDMGGAALVLALAHVIMSLQLPVRLRVMVPCVENSISGNSYRPLDVLRTRAGTTVENGNTDAEGRLILCDALYEASLGCPDVLIDAATLTGAARAALGPDLPAVFTNNDQLWSELEAAAAAQGDLAWRLPLHPGYRKQLDSKVADLSSTGGEGAQGGAILAALYLGEFVKASASSWVHIDTGGWTVGSSAGPGRPEGGEPLLLRSLVEMLRLRYGTPRSSS